MTITSPCAGYPASITLNRVATSPPRYEGTICGQTFAIECDFDEGAAGTYSVNGQSNTFTANCSPLSITGAFSTIGLCGCSDPIEDLFEFEITE